MCFGQKSRFLRNINQCHKFSFKFQVVESRGEAGHNVEYVLKLAEWIRKNLPEVVDDHFLDIEKAVRTKIQLFPADFFGYIWLIPDRNPHYDLPNRHHA